MSIVGEREIRTQRRVIAFFRDALGYAYLGNWQDRPGNRNVERRLLTGWLKGQGQSDKIIDKALRELDKAAALGDSKTLYDVNPGGKRAARRKCIVEPKFEISDQETAKIDALVTKVREAIEHFKELLVALVSAAVTGRIDVREEAA